MVATQLFLSLYRIKIRRNIRIKYWIWGTYAPLGLWAGFSRFFYFGTRWQIPMHFRNLYPLLNCFSFICDFAVCIEKWHKHRGGKKKEQKREITWDQQKSMECHNINLKLLNTLLSGLAQRKEFCGIIFSVLLECTSCFLIMLLENFRLEFFF